MRLGGWPAPPTAATPIGSKAAAVAVLAVAVAVMAAVIQRMARVERHTTLLP